MDNPATQLILGNNNIQISNGNNIIQQLPKNECKPMIALIENYKKEQIENKQFNEIIESLNHYLNPINEENVTVVGLEQKLRDGNYLSYLSFALRMKEQFAKKIIKHMFSNAAQEILVFVLAEVYINFMNSVYPRIIKGEPQEEIMYQIQKEIVDKIQLKLEENVLGIYSDTITGMIYFLTGNCHIKWC